jgi:hypothetical protein
VVRTKLVAVSKLDDGSLPVVPWSSLTSSRRSPQATAPDASRASSPPRRRRRCARRLHR